MIGGTATRTGAALASEDTRVDQGSGAGGIPLNRGGRGSHRNFVHPKVPKPITVSGQPGDDAKQYQERAVRLAIEESKR
jgi:hypothetical protein